MVGVFVPFLVLLIMELSARIAAPGFLAVKGHLKKRTDSEEPKLDHLRRIVWYPARLMAVSIAVLALIVGGLMFFSESRYYTIIGAFAMVLASLSALIFWSIRKHHPKYFK
jgi:hypothetical protein